MHPSDLGLSPLGSMSALVVEPDEADRAFLCATLKAAGLTVTAVESFSDGRRALLARPPSVLVSEIRVGSHNGLHLALLGRGLKKDMTLIVAKVR